VPLPLLFEVGTTSSAFVLCMFHGPQYVSSAASLPGGIKLPVTNIIDYSYSNGFQSSAVLQDTPLAFQIPAWLFISFKARRLLLFLR
jgi:hypothetical protein